jgi:hypothetical protein
MAERDELTRQVKELKQEREFEAASPPIERAKVLLGKMSHGELRELRRLVERKFVAMRKRAMRKYANKRKPGKKREAAPGVEIAA